MAGKLYIIKCKSTSHSQTINVVKKGGEYRIYSSNNTNNGQYVVFVRPKHMQLK